MHVVEGALRRCGGAVITPLCREITQVCTDQRGEFPRDDVAHHSFFFSLDLSFFTVLLWHSVVSYDNKHFHLFSGSPWISLSRYSLDYE